MERIYKLPLMLGFLAALAGGIAGYASGMASSEIYIRMAVMMVAFFVLGLYIRNNIISVKKEVREKLINDALKGIEESKKQKVKDKEQILPKMSSSTSQSNTGQMSSDGQGEAGLEIDENEDDDFKPLHVSKAIRSKISD
jgi:hypothetical protein